MQIQRTLQIQIENQGKHLQMMFEKQKEMGDNKGKGSSSPSNAPSAALSDTAPPSPRVDNLETSIEEHDSRSRSNTDIPEESSQDASAKQRVGDEHAAAAPPTKRVKS